MMDLQRVNAYMSKVEESEKNVLPHEGKRLKTGLDLGTAYIVLVVLDENNQPVACEKRAASVLRDGVVVDSSGACRIVRELKEKLEELGIPVLVEHSSYESHPLGRTEWVKLYGALLGKEDEAEALFEEQASQLKSLENTENTGKTVAFFYINSMGAANVRKAGDYVSKMIDLAGGQYIFKDLGADEEGQSTMNMGMEDFYAGAKDADYIIYNSTIDGELKSLDELLKKSALLKDFKAVKEGNVWCLTKSMFQETTCLGDVIMDMHQMLTEEDPQGLTYLYRLE